MCLFRHDVPLPVVPFVVITAEMTVNYIPEALSNNNNKKRKTKPGRPGDGAISPFRLGLTFDVVRFPISPCGGDRVT